MLTLNELKANSHGSSICCCLFLFLCQRLCKVPCTLLRFSFLDNSIFPGKIGQLSQTCILENRNRNVVGQNKQFCVSFLRNLLIGVEWAHHFAKATKCIFLISSSLLEVTVSQESHFHVKDCQRKCQTVTVIYGGGEWMTQTRNYRYIWDDESSQDENYRLQEFPEPRSNVCINIFFYRNHKLYAIPLVNSSIARLCTESYYKSCLEFKTLQQTQKAHKKSDVGTLYVSKII